METITALLFSGISFPVLFTCDAVFEFSHAREKHLSNTQNSFAFVRILLEEKLLLMNVRIRRLKKLGTFVFNHIKGRNQDCDECEFYNILSH